MAILALIAETITAALYYAGLLVVLPVAVLVGAVLAMRWWRWRR